MGYYDPPEPSWAGSLDRTCNATNEVKVVTPTMEKLLAELKVGPTLGSDPWSVEVVAFYRAKVDLLTREWSTNSGIDFDCTFDGEVDAYEMPGGVLHWTCPVCGHEWAQNVTEEFEPDPVERDDWDVLRDEP